MATDTHSITPPITRYIKEVRRNHTTGDFDAYVICPNHTEIYLGSRSGSWDAEQLCDEYVYAQLQHQPIVEAIEAADNELRPAPRPTVIRLADLREGEERRITYAISFYIASCEPHVAAYAGATLTKINGAPLIAFTSAQVVGLHAVREIATPRPTTAAEYQQLYVAVARHYSTTKYPSFEA